MRWAARLGGPDIDVEDVVQEVFLIAKRRLRTFSGPGSIKTWLFRTTEKIVQAARRKRRLRNWLSRSTEPAASGTAMAGPTPADALEREQEIRQVLTRCSIACRSGSARSWCCSSSKVCRRR